jgi:hypothetical protein
VRAVEEEAVRQPSPLRLRADLWLTQRVLSVVAAVVMVPRLAMEMTDPEKRARLGKTTRKRFEGLRRKAQKTRKLARRVLRRA